MFSTFALVNRIAITNFRSMSQNTSKSLCAVIAELEKFAPTDLAEKWDNTGLLLEPYKEQSISKILLTNDLTENVVNEAIEKRINLIISYHPPIFKPLTRITQQNWKQRLVLACAYHSIAVYSPHTAWDIIKGGVNDWLASALPFQEINPLQEVTEAPSGSGVGRKLTIKGELNVGDAVERLQTHIANHVHVGLASGHDLSTPVRTVALCAGSGSTVLRGVKADLVITGEMSHHDVLDFNHDGVTVLLCNHSNSERGFLKKFQPELTHLLNDQCEVIVSQVDKDPLTTIVNKSILK